MSGVFNFPTEAGDDRYARFLSQLLRFNLVAHRCNGVGRRANKDNPVFGTGLGETLPLRLEAIARMHCIGSSGLACFYNLVGEQIGLSRSEEHTSELQSLMRISYAVFCLKKNNNTPIKHKITLNYHKSAITIHTTECYNELPLIVNITQYNRFI